MKKKELNKKYTIRVDEEDHSLLQELVKDFGTLENALKKVIKFYKERRNKNGKIIKTSST